MNMSEKEREILAEIKKDIEKMDSHIKALEEEGDKIYTGAIAVLKDERLTLEEKYHDFLNEKKSNQ